MAYYLDLFSPETYEAFSKSNREISGFRARQEGMANCTFLSYDSIEELAKLKHLAHLSDSVLDEYTEEAE
jgi:hypothetical protein